MRSGELFYLALAELKSLGCRGGIFRLNWISVETTLLLEAAVQRDGSTVATSWLEVVAQVHPAGEARWLFMGSLGLQFGGGCFTCCLHSLMSWCCAFPNQACVASFLNKSCFCFIHRLKTYHGPQETH